MIHPVATGKNLKPRSAAFRAPADVFSADQILVGECLGRDPLAWKKLVEKYQRLVYSIPLRMGLGANDADEVFQNVFMIAFRELPKLRNQTLFAAWLIKITQNESLRVRKQSWRYVSQNYEITTMRDSAVFDDLETWELQNLLHRALEQLDLQSRQLVMALCLEAPPPSYREVAARLGIAEGSVGPLRARAFKKLETILLDMGFGDYF